MNRIKVLVVDDSSFYRRVITRIIEMDPQMEVVGTAVNGKMAIDMIKVLNPDVITLDLEMPEMDGLETLAYLSQNNIRVGVIVFSAYSHAGARVTLEALERGAFDFVLKPSNDSLMQNLNKISSLLIPRIRLCYARKKSDLLSLSHGKVSIRSLGAPFLAQMSKKEIVAIGGSTGGPNALKEIISGLNPNISIPILVVQHMPPIFTSYLAEKLDRLCPLRVKEARNGEQVVDGVVYIAPGDHHMEVKKGNRGTVIRLHRGPPENNCRPSVDVLFRSVAEAYGGKSLVIILTGIGNDGFRGAKLLKERGACIIAQDEATSVVWGMPRAVVEAGIADKVLPVSRIASAISEMTKDK